jgi:hypothetical protein
MRTTILCGLLAALSVSAGAATIRVPGEYSTIQVAVDAADPGDEIVVEGGVYGVYPDWELTLIITKDVILTGVGDVRIGSLEVRAANVRICGFHLTTLGTIEEQEEPTPYTGIAITVVGKARLTVEDCLIRPWGIGISTCGEAHVELYRCRLEEITEAVASIGHGGSLYAESCVFQSSFGDGIIAYGAARVTGAGNVVSVPGAPFAGDVAPGFVEPSHAPGEVSVRYPSTTYASLQEAVDALRPGGELVLEGGVHPGTVYIGKEIAIRAATGERPMLQGGGGAFSPLCPTILVTSGGVLRLEGVDVSGPTAVLVAGDGFVQMEDSVVRGEWYGLVAQGEAGAHVRSCRFLGSPLASVLQLGRTSVRIEATTIELGMIGVLLSGIDLAYGTYGRLGPGANRLELSDVRIIIGDEPATPTTGLGVVCAESSDLPGLNLVLGFAGIGAGAELVASPLAEGADCVGGDVRIDPRVDFATLPYLPDWWDSLLVGPLDPSGD